MICSIFRCTRQPSGRNVQTPPVTWRTKPPRTSSLWLTASASAGASRKVGRKSLEARAIIVASPGYRRASQAGESSLFQGNRRRLGHREGRGLPHLQALGAEHPVGDPPVDLVKELVDEDVARDLLEDPPVGVDEPDVAAACDPEVGIARLPGAVHGAAEDGHLEDLRVGAEPLLDALGELLHAHVVAAAARTGD